MQKQSLGLFLGLWLLISCSSGVESDSVLTRAAHPDLPFRQDFSVKYYAQEGQQLLQIGSDRNGTTQIVSSDGLLHPHAGAFLYPGELVEDRSYLPFTDLEIRELTIYSGQLVYRNENSVFSNAWAGNFWIDYNLPNATSFCMGPDFGFMVTDGRQLQYYQDKIMVWNTTLAEDILVMKREREGTIIGILTLTQFYTFDTATKKLKKQLTGKDWLDFTFTKKGIAFVGAQGFVLWQTNHTGDLIWQGRVPVLPITSVTDVNGRLWFGSGEGAFSLNADGTFNYYYGQRWLPSNEIRQITSGPDSSVLILTDRGVGQLRFKKMTLLDKARYYENQVRQRHIRHGFDASLGNMDHGNLATGIRKDSDNDGLWTAMYLAGQAFRFAVEGSEEALQNVRESMEAMERLYSINPVKGFPSRSFERSGYIPRLADPHRWQPSPNPGWDWKATTSSDEAIGHIFAFGVVAEIIQDSGLKTQAVRLIDSLLTHILDNDFYLVDFDGKPTTWGRWNPEYVNAQPKMVGDRKLNSSNIIAMLQTAFYFTQKEKYKDAAYELMDRHGYLDNLLRPMDSISVAPPEADEWSKMLSEEWNHSDDEMYFLGYWGLYRYAFTDSLQQLYKAAIIDHWEAERPEKEGAWNIFTAMTGTGEFDLEEAIWYLREYPLDLIDWQVKNSHRKDIELLPDNFRGQTTKEVLPPDERPIRRHNANTFQLDQIRHNGTVEYSAGDIWLLPYWMGRYLEVIQCPMSDVQ